MGLPVVCLFACLFQFYACGCFLYTFVCTLHVDLQRPEGFGSPRTGKSIEPPCLCWELNPDPFDDQPVLLTEKPSLQTPYPPRIIKITEKEELESSSSKSKQRIKIPNPVKRTVFRLLGTHSLWTVYSNLYSFYCSRLFVWVETKGKGAAGRGRGQFLLKASIQNFWMLLRLGSRYSHTLSWLKPVSLSLKVISHTGTT